MKYFETSAKENIGIEETMSEIFEQSINIKFGALNQPNTAAQQDPSQFQQQPDPN